MVGADFVPVGDGNGIAVTGDSAAPTGTSLPSAYTGTRRQECVIRLGVYGFHIIGKAACCLRVGTIWRFQASEKHEKLQIRLWNLRNAQETQKSRDIKQLTLLTRASSARKAGCVQGSGWSQSRFCQADSIVCILVFSFE